MKKQEGSDVPMSSHKRVRRGSSFDSRNVKSREREREREFSKDRAMLLDLSVLRLLFYYCTVYLVVEHPGHSGIRVWFYGVVLFRERFLFDEYFDDVFVGVQTSPVAFV
jgi:hypothetical protein